MNELNDWQIQQLLKIVKTSDCPKGLDCEYCVLHKKCEKHLNEVFYVENSSELKKTMAMEILKAVKLYNVLREK